MTAEKRRRIWLLFVASNRRLKLQQTGSWEVKSCSVLDPLVAHREEKWLPREDVGRGRLWSLAGATRDATDGAAGTQFSELSGATTQTQHVRNVERGVLFPCYSYHRKSVDLAG